MHDGAVTWRQHRLDSTTLNPETRLAYWCEMLERAPVNNARRYEPGPLHARLVLPVPVWAAKVLARWLRP
jgi:hypothetical protein